MMDLLSQLPVATPEEHDSDRVRQRCRVALTRRQPAARSRLDGVLFAAAAVYLFTAVIQLLVSFGPSIP
jgi:hypothetical protein